MNNRLASSIIARTSPRKFKLSPETLCSSVHNDPGAGDKIARLGSIALQHGAPLERIGELLLGAMPNDKELWK